MKVFFNSGLIIDDFKVEGKVPVELTCCKDVREVNIFLKIYMNILSSE